MKTLKYLMLLLAVAVALPAMAQEMEKATMEKASGKVKIGDMAKPKAADVTEGRLSKHHTYSVEVVGTDLFANVTNNKGTTLQMVKSADGRVQKYCYADSKGVCPAGYEYMKKLDISDDRFPEVMKKYEFEVKDNLQEAFAVEYTREYVR